MGDHGAGTLERYEKKCVEGVMTLRSYLCGLLLAGLLILGDFGGIKPLVLAASAKPKNNAKPPVVQPLAPGRQVSLTSPKVVAKQPAKAESGKMITTASERQTPSERVLPKTRRHNKVGKKWRPPAIVKPRLDLSSPGILMQPQRYNFSKDRRTGRAAKPQTGETVQDHFQELD